MKNIAIYVRVSTTEQAQEGYSIPAQISLLKKYAESYDYKVIKIYTDAGISGKNIKDRKELIEMLKDVKQKKFEFVLIWKLSRLSRSLLDLLSIVDTLQKNNISLISYSEHFDTSTPTGKMLLQLLGSIAEFERSTIAENVKMGMNERFNQGLSKSSTPFAYSYVDKQAIVDPDKAQAVKEVYRRFLEDDSTVDLANYLNNLGYKTRVGKPWRQEMVYRMLSNPFYIGHVVSGRKDLKSSVYVTKKGIHEAIIDEDTFSAVQEKLNKRRPGKYIKNSDVDQLCAGLIVCPLCGYFLYYANSSSTRDSKRYSFHHYRCGASSPNRQKCKGFSISKKKVDAAVLDKLKNVLSLDIKAFQKKAKNDDVENNKTNNELKSIDKNLDSLIKTRDRYFDLFETGKVDTNAFSDRINEILLRINTLEKERDTIIESQAEKETSKKDPVEIINSIKTFFDIYDELNYVEKRDILHDIIEKVIVTEDKKDVKIQFKGGFVI